MHYGDQSQATLLMTSGFRQYITEYTVANFRCCQIRRRVIFSSALECDFHGFKNDNFLMKNCDIFVFAQCIDFGYRFEPPLNETASYKYQQSMF